MSAKISDFFPLFFFFNNKKKISRFEIYAYMHENL